MARKLIHPCGQRKTLYPIVQPNTVFSYTHVLFILVLLVIPVLIQLLSHDFSTFSLPSFSCHICLCDFPLRFFIRLNSIIQLTSVFIILFHFVLFMYILHIRLGLYSRHVSVKFIIHLCYSSSSRFSVP